MKQFMHQTAHILLCWNDLSITHERSLASTDIWTQEPPAVPLILLEWMWWSHFSSILGWFFKLTSGSRIFQVSVFKELDSDGSVIIFLLILKYFTGRQTLHYIFCCGQDPDLEYQKPMKASGHFELPSLLLLVAVHASYCLPLISSYVMCKVL